MQCGGVSNVSGPLRMKLCVIHKAGIMALHVNMNLPSSTSFLN